MRPNPTFRSGLAFGGRLSKNVGRGVGTQCLTIRHRTHDREHPMLNRPIAVLALAILSLQTINTQAQTMTAADLQALCVGTEAGSNMACKLYILGMTQGVSLGMSIADGKTQGGRPCIPEEISGSALDLAIRVKMGQDLRVFPEDGKQDAVGFVGAILVKTFPCQKRQ